MLTIRCASELGEKNGFSPRRSLCHPLYSSSNAWLCLSFAAEGELNAMNTPDKNVPVRRRLRKLIWWAVIGFPFYVLSMGPVAWATNDAFHTRYLPEEVWLVYLPLMPLMYFDWIRELFIWYTGVVWEGFPAGYTTI